MKTARPLSRITPDVVCTALTDHDDVVLVGHSFGGYTIPLVADRRPIQHLVYLCALVPDIGRSPLDQLTDKLEMLNPLRDEGLSTPDDQLRQAWTDRDIARTLLYAHCDEPIADAALDRLRPLSLYPATLPFSLNQFPATPATYVVGSDDQMLRPRWSRHIARDRACGQHHRSSRGSLTVPVAAIRRRRIVASASTVVLFDEAGGGPCDKGAP